jgi:hypothetical protein
MIFKKFKCTLYGAEVWYITDCDHVECKQILEKKLNAEVENWEHADSMGFTEIYADPNVFVVWVKDKKDEGTLIHELTHLAIEILNDRGVKLSERENGEVLAYYLEYWWKIFKGKKEKEKI